MIYYTLGIDAGLNGAYALLDEKGQYVDVKDLPTMARGKAMGRVKRQINCPELAQEMKKFKDVVYSSGFGLTITLEFVSSMPEQGIAGAFSFGQTYGSILGVCAALELPINLVHPVSWKKHYTLNKDKEVARATAIQQYPTASLQLARKSDHNRAEALLIAGYGHNRMLNIKFRE